MEAATKKKRGRPIKEKNAFAYKIALDGDENYAGRSMRTIRSIAAAEPFTLCLIDAADPALYLFFHSNEGKLKRIGMAEQLGRMISEGILTEKQALKLAKECMKAYENGTTAKEIEKALRRKRQMQKADYDLIWKKGRLTIDEHTERMDFSTYSKKPASGSWGRIKG